MGPCRFRAAHVSFYRKHCQKMPSAALYVVEVTFSRGFDSFRAHHSLLQSQDLHMAEENGTASDWEGSTPG